MVHSKHEWASRQTKVDSAVDYSQEK